LHGVEHFFSHYRFAMRAQGFENGTVLPQVSVGVEDGSFPGRPFPFIGCSPALIAAIFLVDPPNNDVSAYGAFALYHALSWFNCLVPDLSGSQPLKSRVASEDCLKINHLNS
jgi:hypothetical protein